MFHISKEWFFTGESTQKSCANRRKLNSLDSMKTHSCVKSSTSMALSLQGIQTGSILFLAWHFHKWHSVVERNNKLHRTNIRTSQSAFHEKPPPSPPCAQEITANENASTNAPSNHWAFYNRRSKGTPKTFGLLVGKMACFRKIGMHFTSTKKLWKEFLSNDN